MSREIRVDQYSRTNLPVNKDIALSKCDELLTEISRIETFLDHNDIDTFATDLEYDLWRKRTIHALAFKKQELHFLQGFLNALDSKTNEIKVLPEEIQLFEILYSENSVPKKIEDAHARENHLSALFRVCRYAISDLKYLMVVNRSDQDLIKKYRSFSDKVRNKMDCITQERSTIKKFIRDHHVKNSRISEWKKECIKIINRATAHGFVLTIHESEFYEELIESIA